MSKYSVNDTIKVLTNYEANNAPYLIVDLDNSLVKTDTLWEAILLLIKKNPLFLPVIFIWLTKGKNFFKEQVCSRAVPDATILPYNEKVLQCIETAKCSGKNIILATAANYRIAKRVAEYLGFFNTVLSSDECNNLKGENKLQAIQKLIGEQEFDYIGDSNADVPIWKNAETSIVVEPSSRLFKKLQNKSKLIIINKEISPILVWIKALRVHQWAKNFLIFLPLVMAHRFTELDLLLKACLGFIAFSSCASSVYILNDLLDMESDRSHKSKRNRPFASGNITIPEGMTGLVVALFVAFGLSITFLSVLFTLALGSYLLLTTVYSFKIKRLPLLDVFTLAGLYTFRILAGASAVDVPVSSWLLAFSMFFFLSLALMKRYTDLLLISNKQKRINGRGYLAEDKPLVLSLGVSCGYLSVMVFVLYITSSHVQSLYQQPVLLWLIVPSLLYWITRMWLITHRGRMHNDPIVFTIKDHVSLLVGVFIMAILFISSNSTGASLLNHLILMP